jgi:hypothetical protein
LPVIEALDKVVAPVTPNVPPIVSLPLTVNEVTDDVPADKDPVKDKDVPVAEPMIGVTNVLFESDSVPVKVAKVPLVGKVIFVVPVEVIVVTYAPEVAKVPPSAKDNVALVFGVEIETLLILVAVAAPKIGVTKVGEVKTGLVNVLLVNVSVPAIVANVPVAAGSVIVVVPAIAGATILAAPEVEPL